MDRQVNFALAVGLLLAHVHVSGTLDDPQFGCQERLEILPQGRECRKPCVVDRDCVSRRKRCLCDGACGKSCVKDNQNCEVLPSIPHGVVEINPRNQFGAFANYTCKPGYMLQGDRYRTCQGDMRWSGTEPTCVQSHTKPSTVYCPPPPVLKNTIHNADPLKTRFEENSVVKYDCVEGFSVPPQAKADAIHLAWCVRTGDWVGPNFTCVRAGCPRLGNIQNGFVEQEMRSDSGDTATFYCHAGFFLAGRVKLRCEYTGEWNSKPPTCEKVTCGLPPEIPYAEHDGDIDQQRYSSGFQLTYTCETGYYRVGNDRLTCSGDGEWRGLAISCQPVQCPPLADILNGRRSGYRTTYPSKVEYECYPGHELVGDSELQCQGTGRWSSAVPKCLPVVCSRLFAPLHGMIIDDNGSAFGSVVHIRCETGYRLIGSPERRCQADRTWSGDMPKCVEITCELPKFYNGWLRYDNVSNKSPPLDTILNFQCDIGSEFEGTAFEARCMENGKWSEPTPICWGSCSNPSIPNAIVLSAHKLTYKHTSVIDFRCNSGFEPRGSYKCYNGTWTHAECVPVSCKKPPPHVDNGMRVYLGSEHGNRAKYKCFAGFQLEGMGNPYLTCQYGKWVGGRPHCVEYYCPSPSKSGTFENGRVYKKVSDGLFLFKKYIRTIRHGDRLTYECDRGYRLEGPSGATCVHGRWQPPINNGNTRCVKAIHPPFRSLWHADSTLNQH